MKKYRVEGMMCNHCRMHVEKALNALEGVSASVTLDPPAAEVRFTGRTYSDEESPVRRSRNKRRRKGAEFPKLSVSLRRHQLITAMRIRQ